MAASGRRPLRGRLRRRAADAGEVGGSRPGEPGGAPLHRRLDRAAAPDLRRARPGRRGGGGPPARCRWRPLAFWVGRPRAAVRCHHRRRRRHLAPPGLHRRPSCAPCSAPRACRARVSRRPGYRLVATWRTGGAGGPAAGGGPVRTVDRDPHGCAGRPCLRGRRRRRAVAGAAAPLPVGPRARAAAGGRAGGDGGVAAVRPARTIPPGGCRRCGWTAPAPAVHYRHVRGITTGMDVVWGLRARRTAAPTSPSCTSGPAPAGR